jgi:hypothetical protein
MPDLAVELRTAERPPTKNEKLVRRVSSKTKTKLRKSTSKKSLKLKQDNKPKQMQHCVQIMCNGEYKETAMIAAEKVGPDLRKKMNQQETERALLESELATDNCFEGAPLSPPKSLADMRGYGMQLHFDGGDKWDRWNLFKKLVISKPL